VLSMASSLDLVIHNDALSYIYVLNIVELVVLVIDK